MNIKPRKQRILRHSTRPLRHACETRRSRCTIIAQAEREGARSVGRVRHRLRTGWSALSHAATCDLPLKSGWLDGAGGESSGACLPGLFRVRDCHGMAETPLGGSGRRVPKKARSKGMCLILRLDFYNTRCYSN
jgi:hypothetical protein